MDHPVIDTYRLPRARRFRSLESSDERAWWFIPSAALPLQLPRRLHRRKLRSVYRSERANPAVVNRSGFDAAFTNPFWFSSSLIFRPPIARHRDADWKVSGTDARGGTARGSATRQRHVPLTSRSASHGGCLNGPDPHSCLTAPNVHGQTRWTIQSIAGEGEGTFLRSSCKKRV